MIVIQIEGMEWNLVRFPPSEAAKVFSFSEDESGPNVTDFHVNVVKRAYSASGSKVYFRNGNK